ncbi:MAG: hypothetical protein ACI4SG_01475 [Oligosphaeraceae bacterium]
MFHLVLAAILFPALVVTVLAGNAGLSLPLLSSVAFVFALRGGAGRTLLLALPAAGLLDALWMRERPVQTLAVLLLLWAAHGWRKWGSLDSVSALAAAGTTVGLCTWGCHLLLPGNFSALRLLAALAWSLFLGPLLVWLQEKLLERRLFSALQEEGERLE